MVDIWVTSDTHFGHTNIISYCSRPFESVNQMDEALVQNWNKVVKPGDKVYHLGDVYFGQRTKKGDEHWGKFFSRLNGQKRLILGNHDDGKDKNLLNTFHKIMVWRMFPEFGLLLTHVPVHQSSLTRRESRHVWNKDKQEFEIHESQWTLVNIHGHIHNHESPAGPYKNVCVEMTNYTPVNIEELRVR